MLIVILISERKDTNYFVSCKFFRNIFVLLHHDGII